MRKDRSMWRSVVIAVVVVFREFSSPGSLLENPPQRIPYGLPLTLNACLCYEFSNWALKSGVCG